MARILLVDRGAEKLFESLPHGAKTLWVTSSGGHISELLRIESELAPSSDSLWVTFDTPQTRSVLGDRRREFVDYVAPRDLVKTFSAAKTVRQLLSKEKFDACISTGAAVAAGILALTAARGIQTYYVESLARTGGPSFTGKILALAPKVMTLTQYPTWAGEKWRFDGTILDSWKPSTLDEVPAIQKILVTLGTIRPYDFSRAVNAVSAIVQPGDEVVWQLGASMRAGLTGTAYEEIPQQDLQSEIERADVVVSHAGVGSILQILEAGKSPVLVVRESQHAEHVDNHQNGIARATAERGLTQILDLDSPRRSVFEEAAQTRILPQTNYVKE